MVQSDIDTFEKDFENDNQNLKKIYDSFNEYLSKNTKIEKVSEFQNTSTITSEMAFRNNLSRIKSTKFRPQSNNLSRR